ncbi:hypothetical protein MKJ04_20160 [Pontibacter sp. E15-1]|uniref:hypothetical protein n=1 Tax=Pontibacter sp. E15-1 TaxID=2919918 RepID=UPI001F4F9AED|nr:hypothetical protein [Pontibacter sp. E15-1]MCJ8167166.1 hypothetical protein [Pontibacter sp. E15-1]
MVNKDNCEEEQKLQREFINGVVTDKFEDSRGIRYFRYYNGQDTLLSHWALLKPTFYNYLEVGDSVVKKEGSLIFQIKRGSIDTTQVIDFECK